MKSSRAGTTALAETYPCRAEDPYTCRASHATPSQTPWRHQYCGSDRNNSMSRVAFLMQSALSRNCMNHLSKRRLKMCRMQRPQVMNQNMRISRQKTPTATRSPTSSNNALLWANKKLFDSVRPLATSSKARLSVNISSLIDRGILR